LNPDDSMERDPTPRRDPTQVRRGGQLLAGRHAADRRVRVSRAQPAVKVVVPRLPGRRPTWHPAVVFTYVFGALIVAGTLLLSLPISAASGVWTPPLEALFTATSAVCLTGLVVVDTGTYWSTFGHVVLLILIQVGGIGFMTSSTMLLMLVGSGVTLRQRVLLREAMGGGTLGSVLLLARRVIVFTVVLEVIGAAVLTQRFLAVADPPMALWWGVFHSVSGFNNAGFDLFGGYRSLTIFNQDAALLLTTALRMLAGAISYIVVEDVIAHRRFVRLALDTKLVLLSIGGLTLAGTLAMLFTERNNLGTLGGMEPLPSVLNAFFMAAARTGGFTSLDVGQLTDDGLVVLMALMFIGGAAASTAGGIKVQTFSILFFAITSSIRGHRDVQAFRRRVPQVLVMRALSVALLGVATVFFLFFVLNITEQFPFEDVLFEAFSAFSTVGLSTGITPETSPAGRVILILAMFVGRLGPLSLVLALAAREHRPAYQWPEEPIRIG
jgi:trk system potassium uptake protein